MLRISSHIAYPVFQGQKATQAAQQQFLNGSELSQVLETDDDPYVGRLPKGFAQSLELTDTEALKLLDQIAAHYFQDIDSRPPCFEKQTPHYFQEPPADTCKGRPIIVDHVSPYANFGRVYFFTVNNTRYAFKVFRFSGKYHDVKAFKETATGAYFTHQVTKDLSKHYVAHPPKWTLMEFIDIHKDHVDTRPGRTLEEQGYFFTDLDTNATLAKPNPSANRINGIRIDHGECEPIPEIYD